MSAADELEFPPEFRVVGLADPVVEAVGFPVHDAYVELLWLPVIGPSTTWLVRRLVRFGLASWHGQLAVRTVLPPLSERHLHRLSPALQDAHGRLVAGRRAA